MSIGERIRALRTMRNMTLEELAGITGVSRQTVQRYETGVISNIPSDKVEKISIALGVSPAILMGWEECELLDGESKQGQDLDEFLKSLEAQLDTVMYNGKPINEDSKQKMIGAIEFAIELAKNDMEE